MFNLFYFIPKSTFCVLLFIVLSCKRRKKLYFLVPPNVELTGADGFIARVRVERTVELLGLNISIILFPFFH